MLGMAVRGAVFCKQGYLAFILRPEGRLIWRATVWRLAAPLAAEPGLCLALRFYHLGGLLCGSVVH